MAVFARALRAGLVLTLCCLSATARAQAPAALATAKGTVTVGLLTPSTGSLMLRGRDIDAGFRYFLATHDDTLGGFRATLRAGDEGDSVDVALAHLKTLAEVDKVDVVVGLANSTIAYGVADDLQQRRLPTIVALAGADDLTQRAARANLFRVSYASSQDVMPLGDFTCRRMLRKTAVVVAVDYAFGWEAAGGFARAYRDAGCRIVREIYVPSETGDWTAAVQKIDRDASLVFAVAAGDDAVRFLGAYRTAGLKMPLVGHGVLTDEAFLSREGANALGVLTSLHYAATLPTALNTRFRLGFESLEQRPVSEYVEDGYTSAAVLDAALAKLGPGKVDGDALVAALRGVHVTTPRGNVRFDSRQDVVDDVFVRRVVQVGGRLRNALVATYPNVSQFWRYDPVKYLESEPYAKLKGTWAAP